jgi:hypothetical protein
MRLVKTARGVVVALGSIVMAESAFAQCEGKSGFAKKACEVAAGNGAPTPGLNPSALAGMKGSPLSTTFADAIHLDTLPPEMEPKACQFLMKLDRADDGSFLLNKPGIYEAYVQSYMLDINGSAVPRVGGFFPAPIKGRRATVIGDALKQIELHPEVAQADVQALLSQIVSGADLEKMPAPVQQTAARILSKDMLASLKGSVEAKAVEAKLLSIVNRRLRNPQGTKPSAEPSRKDTGSEAGAESGEAEAASGASDGPVLRGTWAEMPGGFYVRYLPESYMKVRVQVMVPDAALAQADPKNPLSFDPTQYLAVYSQTPAQRLGISLRPAK